MVEEDQQVPTMPAHDTVPTWQFSVFKHHVTCYATRKRATIAIATKRSTSECKKWWHGPLNATDCNCLQTLIILKLMLLPPMTTTSMHATLQLHWLILKHTKGHIFCLLHFSASDQLEGNKAMCFGRPNRTRSEENVQLS